MAHPWKFFRAGGFDQVKIESGTDLANLDQLDQKLWTALACPTTGIEFDPRTAELLDADKDGRIRAPELIAACKFATKSLKNPDTILKESDSLPLENIADAGIASAAKQLASFLGKPQATSLSVAEVSDSVKIFANTLANGDGVIIADASPDDATKAAFADIAGITGTVPDRSSKPGLNQKHLDTFYAEAKAYSDWQIKAEAAAANILPLGEATAAAAGAVAAIRAKVDDYFGRCRLAAFDSRAGTLLNRKEEEYVAIAGKDLSINAGEISAFPLAQIAPGKALPLKIGVNPAHAAAVTALANAAVKPLLGEKTEITEADWATVQTKLAGYTTWAGEKAGGTVEKLGVKRLRELLTGPTKAKLADLMKADMAKETEAAGIADVEKLVRFHRDLHRLVINFVNFKDLYDGGSPAIFQVGTLYLDQRSCGLCLAVADAGAHATMAALSGTYLAYVDCVRKGSGEKMQIVAAFTDGDSDNLMVGRNGIFYDRKGKDYDATITKILDNPISVRQAFWSPYKKFVRLIEEQIGKRAAAADGAATAKLGAAATDVAAAKVPAPEAKKIDVGTVAALGVAVGAIGGFLTAASSGLATVVSYGPLAIIGLIIGLMLMISIPSCIIAYLKLRKRSLGPMLDANGWAINSKAKINVPFGATLTGIAKLPTGSSVDASDAFAEKDIVRTLIRWAILIALLTLAYKFIYAGGFLYDWTKGSFGLPRGTVPAAITAPAVTVPVVEAVKETVKEAVK